MNFKYTVKIFVIIFGCTISLNLIVFSSQASEREKIYQEEEERFLASSVDKNDSGSKKVQTTVILSSGQNSDAKEQQKTKSRAEVYQEIEELLQK